MVKPGVGIVTPSPKTSSGGRWAYLAAYGWALKTNGNNDAAARAYVAKLYRNVPKLDSGARGATLTFTKNARGRRAAGLGERGHADPSRTRASTRSSGPPSEYPRRAAGRRGGQERGQARHTRDVATAYLSYLYTEDGQTLAAKHFYRPRLASVAKQYTAQFPTIPLFDMEGLFGGWPTAQKTHFADGGVFDQIYGKK